MTFSTLSRTALAAALLLLASGATAQVVNEDTEAPVALDGTYDATGATTTITGELTAAGATAAAAFQTGNQDIDCYAITIADPAAFSATVASDFDSALALFDVSLNGVLFNEDISDSDFDASLPVGSFTGTAGDYVLCVGDFVFMPLNAAAAEIFDYVDFTDVIGPTAADPVLASFSTGSLNEGPYQVDLTGTGIISGGGVEIDVIGFTDEPQRNDFVFIRALATNSSASAIRTRVYFTVDYPDGSDRTYSVLSSDFPGNSSFQVQKIKQIKFPIPPDAPAGTYTVTLFAADDIASGGTVYDSEAFTFDLDPIALPKAGASGAEAGPNPFRSTTTIRYEIAEAAEVDLRVYDVTGREVAVLASGVQGAGAHAAVFAAGDLPNGVYVWRLAVEGEVSAGRVTLAR